MDSRATPGGMARRTFLAASFSGLATVVLASCTEPQPTPSPPPTGSPTTSPTPSPAPTPSPVPEPLGLRRSRWGADPFARGAFTFDAAGGPDELREALAQPVAGRVFFAGEACDTAAPGTLQGARSSGAHAASLVLELAEPGERVAVIGAGLAGLTAARELAERDLEVVVIEARDRIGGRIDTVDADGFDGPIELGALVVGSAVLQAALPDSVELLPIAAPADARTADGTTVAIPTTGPDAIAAAQAWAAAQTGARVGELSLATALVESGTTASLSNEPDATGVSPAAWLAHSVTSGVGVETGATANRVAALAELGRGAVAAGPATGADPDAPSSTAPALARGLAGALDADADALDIAVMSVVTRIAYDERRVSLRLDSGESLTVDRVVVTVPLGVLKTDTLQFSPALPLLHQRAISRLGVGLVDTVWLRFEEAFWRPANEAGDAGDTGAEASVAVLTVVGETPSVAAWLDAGAPDGEPVLVGLIAATQAERLEALDDAAFREAVLADLVPFATATG
ncbi:FAD-dependent oxidoreductase [Agromyces sp. NPDC058126]|uniref:flavin monoamine oxidase family protein n=1 Tax=Agromyces sp. NPDC058126 TaxID=3346350 RepID=UPI0036D9D422